MPVHRLPGRKGRVFVRAAELEALRPLIPTRFASMQELVSRAIARLGAAVKAFR
jgi:hypothetical protein